MKQIFIATIMVALVLTIPIINVHGIAFAHRHYDYQDDSGQGYYNQPSYPSNDNQDNQDNQDNTVSSDASDNQPSPLAKLGCSIVAGAVGSLIGNAIAPGVGTLLGTAASDSDFCKH